MRHAHGDTAAGVEADHGDVRPTDIPGRGWKSILTSVYRNITDHRVLSIAAGSAFYAILALAPALAAGVSLYGLFADTGRISELLAGLSGVLPTGVIDIVRDQLSRLAAQPRSTL